MPGGITLKESTPANITNPDAGKDTIFIDSTVTPPAPAYKDSLGVTRSLVGPSGPNGKDGISVVPVDGIDGLDLLIPGPAGPTGATGPAGASSLTSLYTNSGTNASAGATTVDSYALASQLGANDTLLIYLNVESNTASTTTAGKIINVTDANLQIVSCGNLSGNSDGVCTIIIRASQSSTKRIDAARMGIFNGSSDILGGNRIAFTTDWTGAWTIGLAHNGVTATGTFTWRWSIYKITG